MELESQHLQAGNWRKIKVDEEVGNFIKKGEKLFGFTHRGEAIYSINTKDERKPGKKCLMRLISSFMMWISWEIRYGLQLHPIIRVMTIPQ